MQTTSYGFEYPVKKPPALAHLNADARLDGGEADIADQITVVRVAL